MAETLTNSQAVQYLDMENDQLYSMLVPPGQLQAYNRDGLNARGREIFRMVWKESHGAICAEYTRRKETVTNSVDVACLIAAAASGNVILVGIPLFAFAALATKIGLSELCANSKE